MRYLIPIIILFSISCNDAKNTQDFFEMEKNNVAEKSSRDITIKIQIALKERGYELDVTGKIDEETRKAMMQFQKDNDLPHQYPQGPLLTIKALGIEY